MNYQRLVNGLTLLGFGFEYYVNTRQLSRLEHRSPPRSLKAYFDILKDSSNFGPSQLYLRDKLRFGQLTSIVSLFESLALSTEVVSVALGFAATTGLKALWDFSGSFSFVQKHGEIIHSLSFVICSSIISIPTSIPASLYKTFVIEEKVP